MRHSYSYFIPPNIFALLFSSFTSLQTPFSSQRLSTCEAAQDLPSTPNNLQFNTFISVSALHFWNDRDVREESSHDYSDQQVFLSHSGKQKDFVEQLFMDLKRENISCFFDKDPDSLPKGEDFQSRIFEAANKCKVAVVVLSEDFISSKWPMQERSAFLAAKNSTNPNLIILPLFFRLSTDEFFQKLQNRASLKRSWQKSLKAQKRRIDLDEWLNALEALRRINGVNYVEQQGEVAYTSQIVGHIRRHVPPTLKYEDSYVQGKERLCQEVAELFKNAPCCENGVKIAGLYGVPGIGKTTLARVLCNFYSNDFDGRVFHVELGKPSPIETLKGALTNLTDASETIVNSVRTMEQGWRLLKQMMYGKEVFLAVDNISDLAESIEEAQMYLSAISSAGTQSMIRLTARSSTVLKRFIWEEERWCMHVPSLQEEEAMAVLLRLTPLKDRNLSNEAKAIARHYVRRCYFPRYDTYHPLVLKVFGAYLYDKFDSCADPSRWIDDIHNSSDPWRSGDTQEVIYSIFKDSFQSLREEHRMVFMLLCLYLPDSKMTWEEALNWLALACSRGVEDIKSAVMQLQRKGFVERTRGFGYELLYVHDLFREFAAHKADGRGEWISLKDSDEIPLSLQEALSSNRPRFLAMKIDNCHFPCPGFVNDELFRNILVLHLQHMPQLKFLNLSPMRIGRSITIVGCGGMEGIHGLENLTSLAYIRIEGCSANIQLLGIEHLVALQHLQIHATLPKTVTEVLPWRQVWFPPLQCLSNCGSFQLDHFQKNNGQLQLSGCPKLQTIKLSDCYITQIDFSGCGELREIELRYCENLSDIHLPSRHLSATQTSGSTLTSLHLEGMSRVKEFPSFTGLIHLEYLSLVEMNGVKELPSLTGLINLTQLSLEGMHNLQELPSLTGLINLKQLRLEGMHNLQELPSLTGLINLKQLSLEGMHNLAALPTLAGLINLRTLRLRRMHSLKECLNLTELTGLKSLVLGGVMQWLKEILSGLSGLENLEVEDMHGLKDVLDLTGLTSLRCLCLGGGVQCVKGISIGIPTGLHFIYSVSPQGVEIVKKLQSQHVMRALRMRFLNGTGVWCCWRACLAHTCVISGSCSCNDHEDCS